MPLRERQEISDVGSNLDCGRLAGGAGLPVTARADENGTVGGAVAGGIGGAIVGGPVGLVVGGVGGAVVGNAMTNHHYRRYAAHHPYTTPPSKAGREPSLPQSRPSTSRRRRRVRRARQLMPVMIACSGAPEWRGARRPASCGADIA